jgi:AcrR family transcriptional regulator
MFPSVAGRRGSDELEPEKLPPGRHGLSRAFVAKNQRDRILSAVADVTSVAGYGPMSVEDVIVTAGVSRRTFYEHFKNKEEVFLAAYDHVVDLVLSEVSTAYARGDTWIDRVRRGLEAFVDLLAAQPALAHVCVVDVLTAGPKALTRRSAAIDRFRAFLAPGLDGASDDVRAPALAADTVVGGIYEVIYSHVLRGDSARLPDLAPELLHGMLVPFVGREEAVRASQAAAQARALYLNGPPA